MRKLTTLPLMIAALSSCAAPKTLILSTPAVSMTDSSFDPGARFTAGDEISSRYCRGEQAATASQDELNVGLMDEVVYQAQKDSGAQYIANAKFFSQGSCMLLEGTPMKKGNP